MSEPVNPFAPFFDEFRRIVREEIAAAFNGHGQQGPLTAEQLAAELNLNKATIYQWVKDGEIPYLKVGRKLRFNLQAVLDSQKKNGKPLDNE